MVRFTCFDENIPTKKTQEHPNVNDTIDNFGYSTISVLCNKITRDAPHSFVFLAYVPIVCNNVRKMVLE